MKILIAGMQRSGSTFTFNIVREALLDSGSVFCIATNNYQEALDKSREYKHLIIKSHLPDENMTAAVISKKLICISSYRNTTNAIESWMSTFNFSFEESVESILAWTKWQRKVSKQILNIHFYIIDNFPLLATVIIYSYIFHKLSLKKCYQISKKYSKKNVYDLVSKLKPDQDKTINLNFSYYDKVTFFHRNHISIKSSTIPKHKLTTNQKKIVDTIFKI